MMSMIDIHLPAAVNAVSVAHMEKILNQGYVYPGLSSSELKRAEIKRKKMINTLNAGFSELESFYGKIKSERIPPSALNEEFEQRLDFLALKTAGIIAYVAAFRNNATSQVATLGFFNEAIALLVKTNNLVSDIKIYVMELRADQDTSSSETFSSLDDMFNRLHS